MFVYLKKCSECQNVNIFLKNTNCLGAPHFSTSLKWPRFSWPSMSNLRHHAKLFGVSLNFAFSEVFLVKKADK